MAVRARDQLVVRGARQHNLRDLDITLPKDSLIVFTGVSGSGKSSLAFDTIYAEGQRRYIESLSAYARQFLKQTPQPDVDAIEGLAPAISIEQKGTGHNPRSTVGTITEVYDYLRVLYAALGTAHCPGCGTRIGAQTREQILGRLLALPRGARLHVLAPVAQGRRGEYRDLFDDMRRRGYIRARVDGEYADLTTDLELDRYRRHTIEVVIDRGTVGRPGFASADRARLAEAVEAALEMGEGTLIGHWDAASGSDQGSGGDVLLSSHYACPSCAASFAPPTHASFSFNSPQGMCPTCDGLGTKIEFDPDLLIQRPARSLLKGAMPTIRGLRNRWRQSQFEGVARRYGFPLETPIQDLSEEQLKRLLYGSGGERVEYHFVDRRGRWEHRWAAPWDGIIPSEMDRYRRIRARTLRARLEALMRRTSCPDCGGARLRPEALAVTIGGKSIAEVCASSIGEAHAFFQELVFEAAEARIAEDALKEIRGRLGFLMDVGLHYLTLDRTAPTLAGGESQRIRLASQIGSGLVGVLYVLDEPSIGLHHRDSARLLRTLQNLRDLGNTVVVVEHDEDTMLAADHIVDFGPGAGEHGGEAVVAGSLSEVLRCKESLTGQYLRGELEIPIPEHRRARNGKALTVRGAREHNLQDVSVRIPRHQLTVFSGVSGSGKSSMAMDTIYAEGQRRYIESLSAYARQFLGQMKKPKVDQVTGLSPAICIEQKAASQSPRSTVGTVTEVYDYLRALYARLGKAHCPDCGIEVSARTPSQITDDVLERHEGRTVLVLAPVEPKGNEEYADVLDRVQREGFRRVRLDGKVIELGEKVSINRRRRHRLELVVDRIKVSGGPWGAARSRRRLADTVEQALDRAGGSLAVLDHETGETRAYSQHASCEGCGRTFEPLTPRGFSFNHAEGWCPACDGLGIERAADAKTAIPDSLRSLRAGAVAAWGPLEKGSLLAQVVEAVAKSKGVDVDCPWRDLTADQRDVILYGTGKRWYRAAGMQVQFKGVFPAFEEATRLSWHYRHRLGRVVRDLPCRACRGGRLNPVAAAVRLRQRSLPALCDLPLDQTLDFLGDLNLTRPEAARAGEVLEEARRRLRFLVEVGLEYVSLGRAAPTLSGGESQRVRLAGQIGSGLTGVLYVLDEPTIGLHPRDNARLLGALKSLRDLGNTLITVEHDRDTLEAADHVVDFGPGAGPLGGHVVAAGTRQAVQRRKGSLTGQYLAGKLAIPVPVDRRQPATPLPGPVDRQHPEAARGWLTIAGARHNNLRDLDAHFPLGLLTCVTGPSGSGKSSLVHDILHRHLAHVLHRARTVAEEHDAILGGEAIDKVINIDQAPIGNSPRSNPATYTRAFDRIRELFAQIPEARVRGYTGLRFSYNHRGGRCETCWGLGSRCVDMHFLPDVWVECEECHGARFNAETLQVRYRGASIADVLAMTAQQAGEHFALQPRIRRQLQMLVDVGLGYMQLGQAAPTLSGGEAQRVKLARELARPGTGQTLYLLDEPTTGLHVADVARLLKVLNRLVEAGNTALVIEHNMEVAAAADWVVDLGPGGGDEGGDLVACGPPEQVARAPGSPTAPFLAAALERAPRVPRQELVLASEEPSARRPGGDEGGMPAGEVQDDALIDAAARPPWEIDGRAWHLKDRILQDGRTPDWQVDALEYLTDLVSGLDGMAEVEWQRRDRVVIKPQGKRPAFFLQVRANEYWWFRAEFRTEKGRFDQGDLARQLKIKTWDDLPERQVYGRWSRVRVQARQKRWDHVTLFLWSREEMDTAAFRKFIDDCWAGYRKVVGAGGGDHV